ncbi:aspartyl protease family protein [Canna indica]|uniref:Aspartyl protease family protein n=1 Tax=Canna indica TaxID=4628 RepID=A0AAQ3QI90_9LILI|nr:aspartyl protease family protein [Canna indica]
MASPSFYFAFFLLSLAFSSACLLVCGEEDRTDIEVDTQFLLPNDACSASNKGTLSSKKASLRVVHRQGPCSPLIGRQKRISHEQILIQDQAHVDSLQRRVSTTSSLGEHPNLDGLAASAIPARNGHSLETANYIVTVAFGTPKKAQTIIFDTGSDVTWVQCQPCVGSCYMQQDPLFDPSQSSTYTNTSCSSAFCDELTARGCSGKTCLYGVQYGDGSITVGFYAEDTLTLSPYEVLPHFRFGCGERNEGIFGEVAGILGLGRGKPSLVSQTYPKYGEVFAYCLPPTESSTGYLTFGSGYPSSTKLQYTPMLSEARAPSFYFLTLTAISVGGQQLPVSPAVFSKGGSIIDSGTVITRLPPTAYAALRSAFRQAMSVYKSAPALSILDTCYDLSGYDKVKIPVVALYLGGGVKLELGEAGTLYVASSSQVCLAFAANGDDSDMGILGNVQQRGLNVVYDVPKKVIGFSYGGC